MFLLRKIARVLRGAATPFQIHAACILGAMFGFVPSVARSPALVLGLLLALAILNANLLVAGLVAGAAKLASLALMGVSFALGRFLLDGPARGLLEPMINAPVLAFGGFEWYVVPGGLLLGLLFGVLAGIAINLPIRKFRAAMTRAEESSDFYQRHRRKAWFRLLFFLLFGARHGEASYRDLLTRKVGIPLRIPGLIAAVVVVAGAWLFAGRLAQPLLASGLQSGLEAANGATVDLGRVELDLGASRLALHDLALADAEELDRDLFRAALLECDVSGSDLLRKRLRLDRVVAREAVHGIRRATPGVRLAPPSEPSPPPPAADAEEKTLDDWLVTAQAWKVRLRQAREWMDKLRRAPAADRSGEPTLRERLEREVAARGWRNVAATHLVAGSPLLEIGELLVEGMRSEKLDGRLLDLRIEHLSTHPALVDGAPRVTLRTRDGGLAIDLSLGSEARVPGQSRLDLRCTGLDVARLMQPIEAKTGVKSLEGGTIDAGFHLAWSAGGVAAFDTPLDVKVKDSTIRLPKLGAAKVAELAVPLALRGPLDNPRIRLDAARLADNLVKAGASALGNQLKAEAERRAGEAIDEAAERARKALADEASKRLGDEAKKAVGDEAKRALEELNPFGKKKKDGPP